MNPHPKTAWSKKPIYQHTQKRTQKAWVQKKIEKERKKPDAGTERNCEKTRGEVH